MIRNPNKLTASLTVLAAAVSLGCTACEGGKNPGKDSKNPGFETCLSPRAVSERTPGDTNPSVTSKSNTWRLGRIILSGMPADASSYVGRVVGYRNPDAPGDLWHDSNQITETGKLPILVKIGPGPVAFSLYTVNIAGSPNCDPQATPPTAFEPVTPLTNLIDANPHAVAPKWN